MNGRPFEHDRWNDPIPDLEAMISATECTGLIPAQTEDLAQGATPGDLESIRHMTPPEAKKKKAPSRWFSPQAPGRKPGRFFMARIQPSRHRPFRF